MGIIGDSLEAADRRATTRPIPKTAPAQMRYLVKQTKSTRAAAQLLGVSQRTVERYVRGQLKQPRAGLAAALERAVRQRWQPQVRRRARQRAATSEGVIIDTRARFGYTAAPGTTDDGRIRHLTQALPPAYAARLFDAQSAGAPEQQLRNIIAEGLQEIYFKDRGRRASGLLVEFTDIDYISVEFGA